MSTRDLPSGMAASLQAKVVRYGLLLDADFIDTGTGLPVTTYSWTGIGDLDFEGFTWKGIGGLLGISRVQETDDASSRGLDVSLSGIAAADISLALQSTRIKLPGRIRLATFDGDWQVIGAKTLFRGRLSIPRIRDSGDKCILSISYENESIDLDRPREWRFTDEHQQLLYPGDTGLKGIAALVDRELIFGAR